MIAAVTTLSGAAQGVGLLVAGLVAESVGTLRVPDAQASLYLLCGVLALVFLGVAKAKGREAPERANNGVTDSAAGSADPRVDAKPAHIARRFRLRHVGCRCVATG